MQNCKYCGKPTSGGSLDIEIHENKREGAELLSVLQDFPRRLGLLFEDEFVHADPNCKRDGAKSAAKSRKIRRLSVMLKASLESEDVFCWVLAEGNADDNASNVGVEDGLDKVSFPGDELMLGVSELVTETERPGSRLVFCPSLIDDLLIIGVFGPSGEEMELLGQILPNRLGVEDYGAVVRANNGEVVQGGVREEGTPLCRTEGSVEALLNEFPPLSLI
ncbi:hypothetical protein GIB67_039068 [Kingdonia uniflora]|uniref:Uncharacterized protein n=1 Tax=Kingdonia uniflora TaxID=39325 RepID=A0A7J7LKU2_9MAGN|nr:hypothetical protein GIB67_039068 [Kingdonia uniflora]